MKLYKYVSTAFALYLGLGPSSGYAETFRSGTWLNPGAQDEIFLQDFAKLINDYSKGEIQFSVTSGGALLTAKGSLTELSAGLAQLGNITANYIPSDLPMDAVASDVSFVADDQLAATFAKTELNFFNKQMLGELQAKGVVFASGFDVGTYSLICNFNATKLSDFAGKKIRTVNAAQIGFIAQIGGASVSAPSNETYTSFQNGTLDCSVGTALHLTTFNKLHEVAKSVYLISLGHSTNGGFYFNADFWKDRTPEERRMLLKAAARAEAMEMINYVKGREDAWATARKSGVTLNEPESEAVEKINAYKKAFLGDLAKAEMEKRKIADPSSVINDFVTNFEKWKMTLAGVDTTNVDVLTDLLDREIFDKVDVNTYGMSQ